MLASVSSCRYQTSAASGASSADCRRHFFKEAREIDWLGVVIVAASLERPLAIVRHRVGR